MCSSDLARNFPLYDTYELTVGEDGFNGAITSAQWECYDYDDDGEPDECWGADLALYLYEYSFNPDDTYDNILGANRSEERRVGKECRSRWSP